MNNSFDLIIKKHFSRVSSQSLCAGMSTFIMGLVAHLFILTNEFANHDDILFLWEEKVFDLWKTRWFQAICSPLVSLWGSGLMAGLFCLLILAISSTLLVDTLEIESYVMSIITGAMMSATPIVSSFMSYANGSFLFVVGIPFAIIAFRWYDKGIKGFLIASFAIMISIAGYQSNICITIACIYVQLFVRMLEKEFEIKQWWKDFARGFFVLLIGLILYIISMQIIGSVNGIKNLTIGISGGQLTSHGYAAQAETGTFYVSYFFSTIIIAIKYFIKYHFNIFFGGPNISFASHVIVFANILIVFSSLFVLITSIIKQNSIIRKIMMIIVASVMPICINFTPLLLNGKCDESLNMMYSMVIVVPLVVCVTEKCKMLYDKQKTRVILICFFALIIHLYGNFQIINDAYQRMNSAYETAFSEMTRIIDRVEQTKEWQNGERLLYFDFEGDKGYLINENYQAMTLRDNYIDMGWMGIMGTGVYKFWNNKNTSNFAKCYLGIEFDTPSDDIIKKIKESSEYKSLEKFPSLKAVKVIEGVVVVRMD